MKKRNNFFRSLRFRILIILIILGIVPGVIVTYTMLHNYQDRAVSMLTETVSNQCEILSNLIIMENYLNDTSSDVVNSKLELFSNVYNETLLNQQSAHGGSDPGKVGINDALEKDINLQLSKKLTEIFQNKKYDVIMTRTEDKGLADTKVGDLKARVELINQTKPDIVISIHQNSYSEEAIKGAQVFYYKHSKKREEAALKIQEALCNMDGENTRQAKANETYYLLKKTEVPVVIVECGFLSNSEEAALLVTEEYLGSLE